LKGRECHHLHNQAGRNQSIMLQIEHATEGRWMELIFR
jgi:hypothetical protein